jgi:receptor protein-tyrosine kinase
MEMQGYLNLAKRRWWLLILGPALAVFVAYYITQQITPSYRSNAQLLVTNLKPVDPAAAAIATPTPGLDLGLNGLQVDERLTNTYVNLVKRRPVLEAVIARLALPMTPDDLGDKISVSSIKDTQIIVVSVEDHDPVLAAAIANAAAEEFVNSLGVQLGQTGTVSVAEQATPASSPFKPSLMTNVLLAIVLGGMVAAGIAVALEYLDDTVKDPEDLEPLGLTSLGEISKFGRSPQDDNLVVSDFNSRPAEAYRQLRTNIRFAGIGSGLKTLVVTSAHPGEGKSTTAANLAAVLAQAGDRVILVDADLRRSSLRKTFEGPASFGLTGLLYNDLSDPSVALVMTRWKNLRILPAGTLPPNPSELLTSKRMVRVMEGLRNLADYVIFDTPPVLAVTDATVLAARTDGTIFVAEAGKTRSSTLRESARLLTQANARIAGVVLNRAKGDRAGYYYYRRDETEASVEVEADTIRKAVVQPATSTSITPRAIEPAEQVRPADVEPRVSPAEVPPTAAAASWTNGKTNGNGNGHSNGNGHANGNGNGNGHGNGNGQYVPARVPEPVLAGDHFEETMESLISRMGDTMGLIRSLKPDSKNEPPGGL